MHPQSFLSLLQFSDGLFPAGGYAHSFGLETYVQKGIVRDAEGVEAFLASYLEGSVGPCDAVAAVRAAAMARKGDLAGCLNLDETLDAMKTVSEFREASRQMGRQSLRIAAALSDHALLSDFAERVESLRAPGHHPVIFGIIGGAFDWEPIEVATAYLYATSALVVGASLRLLPLGQMAGQRMLHALWPVIERLALEATQGRGSEDLWSFAPGIEIAGMQHAALDGRLFRS
jgi:urease accessory protein